MAVDNFKDGGKTGSEETLLDFTFDDSPESPLIQPKGSNAGGAIEEIIELVNPIKRGEIQEDILEGISGEAESPSVKDAISGDESAGDDLNSLDKEIAAIFSDQPPSRPQVNSEVIPAIEGIESMGADKTLSSQVPLGISEDRLEAIIAKAVNDAVERVAGQAIEAAAERAIREAIDALKESLKVSRG